MMGSLKNLYKGVIADIPSLQTLSKVLEMKAHSFNLD